ncbi:MAG: M48 family metalloprotease [Acidobacteriaceae bacterium]
MRSQKATSKRSSWNRGWTVALLLVCAALPSLASENKKAALTPTPLTPEMVRLIDQASLHEKNVLKVLEQRTPVVETYLQDFVPDQQLRAVPISDRYFLGRVDFGRVIEDKQYEEPGAKKRFFKGSSLFVGQLTKIFKVEYISQGFVQMLLLDAYDFDRQHYEFRFVRREFLGNVRTYMFDVAPQAGSGTGRFLGRIWIEDTGGNIVRFNGTYTQSKGRDLYYHFDSWRTNIQPGLWLPSAVYVEEHGSGVADKASFFRAQTWIWGYSLKQPASISDNATVEIDAVKDQSEGEQDISPLQASRMWADQAEQNILERLYQAGLLAGPSDFDKVLETVTNNLLVTNNLVLPEPVRCRVMLTTPLESLTIGNTIVLSKGLIDTLPTEEDLAAVLAFQLAHLALGHQVDTEYAFQDNLMFQDQAAFRRLALHHTDAENEAAAKKAIELLKNSPYKDKLGNVGLYFEALESRAKALPYLMRPELGDSLFRSPADDQVWLSALMKGAPKLDMGKLDQIPALPLGSRLHIDSWTDAVEQTNVKPVPVISPGDKMPFEVTPIFFHLRTYEQPQKTPTATGTSSTPGAVPNASGTPAPQ